LDDGHPEPGVPWRDALLSVKPDTLFRWQRKGFRLFWRWKSKPRGRPRLANDLRQLICEMAAENSTWGEERIANELKLKLGIRVSPRTVQKYLRDGPVRTPDPKQRWLTFFHNHAKVIVACDFFVVVTATFRTLYVFVIMELGTRRVLHQNVTAEWTLQQFREALPGDHPYRFVIHDRDSIFFKAVGQGRDGPGRENSSNSRAGTHGKLHMRTVWREPTSRVLGLPNSAQRTPPENDRQRMGTPLQPGPTALRTRSWNSGTQPGKCSGQRPQTQAARRLPRCEDVCAWRLAS
jgi:hypothetical protein